MPKTELSDIRKLELKLVSVNIHKYWHSTGLSFIMQIPACDVVRRFYAN